MLKTLRFMMLAALMMVCGNIFAQEETTVTWEASSGDALATIYADNNITLTWVEGGGDFAPKYTNGSVYFYNGNRVIVSGVTTDVTIKKIVFTFSSGNASMVTCNASGKNESSYGITNSSANMTSTWEGEANSLIFRAPKQTGVRYINSITVTYTGGTTGDVDKAPVLNITTTNWNDTYDMDENGVFVVYAKNEGNLAAENAKLTVYVDDAVNTAWEVGTLAIGADNVWKNMKYDLEGIEAGKHQVKLALTADNADAFEVEKEVTFTKAAAEATFDLSAQDVTVQLPAEIITINVHVKNTSDVDAENVTIDLWNNGKIASETIAELAAGAETDVTFTIDALAAGTYEMQALTSDNKYGCNFKVTVNEEEVTPVYDLAITEVAGTLDLANTTNNVRVSVLNNGNQDITDAPVTLKAGENVLGTSTVSAAAGQTGFCTIVVASEGLEAGQLEVTATVEVENDLTIADNTMTTTLEVKAKPAPEATFTVAAENVTVPFGAQSFNIVATITNTSEIDAQGLTVKLLKGIEVVETKGDDIILEAGKSTTVTFTINAPEGGFVAGTAMYYIQAGNAQDEVEVTFEAEPAEDIIDMALTQITGISEINLKEDNTIMVWVANNGNVATDATVSVTLNGTLLETKSLTAPAAQDGYASNVNVTFVLPTENLVAGTDATVVATLTVENNKEGNTVELSKTLPVVSGEAEPAAEISINPISSWEVEAGEQTVNVTVTLFNNGDADAKNVTVELYKSYGDGLCEAQTVDVPAGENNWKILNFSFTYTFETGKSYEFTAFTNYMDADPENQMQKFTITCPAPQADLTLERIADIKATTEEDVKVVAVVKNLTDIPAENVLVALYDGITPVEDMKSVDVEANGQATVEFNLGKMAAGTYNYTVVISSTDANAENNTQPVTIKVSEPVAEVVDMAITTIQGISKIDLTKENNISVWYENMGNVDIQGVTIAVTMNGTLVETKAVDAIVKPEATGYMTFTLPTEGLVAGETAKVIATVTVENDGNETNNSFEQDYVIVDGETVEPTFTVVAENVTVPFGAQSFEISATITNTSEIDAQGLTVKLLKGIEEVETKGIDILLEAGKSTTVTFTITAPEGGFEAGTAYYFVQAGNGQAEVEVTFEAEQPAEVVDMAITTIQGISKIDLTKENNISVWYENMGNVDVEGVTIAVTMNGTLIETKAVDAIVKPEATGYMTFTLPTEGLTAGETAKVIATVTVENDGNETNNSFEQDYLVVDGETVEPTFSVVAENVTVPFGAQSFEISATITNTSEIDAQGLTVKLLKGIEVVETKGIDILLEAGKSTTVTFTIDAPEGGFVAGTAMYYVQAGNGQAEVEVTFEAEQPAGDVDLAITQISGDLSLKVESNRLGVWVENKGTADVNNADVALRYGDAIQPGTVSVKAGEGSFCWFTITAEELQAGEFTVTATVNAEGDIDDTNNTLSRTFNIAPVLTFAAEDISVDKDAESFTVAVTVNNPSNVAVEGVTLVVMNGAEAIAASEAVTVEGGVTTVNITVDRKLEKSTTLAITYNGETVASLTATVYDPTGIAALRAQYGQNVQIFTLSGKKVNDVRKGNVYIVNGHKVVIK